ncbi:MAG: heavy metal-associated domain-containing protein [Pseudomonadota bacterium]
MNKLLTTLALALAATAAAPAFAVTTMKATVNGMVCAFCAQGIEKRLSMLPAAKAVFVDLKQKVVAVELKDGQTLDGKVITAEIVEAGYDVVKIESITKSVADIKAEAKARK